MPEESPGTFATLGLLFFLLGCQHPVVPLTALQRTVALDPVQATPPVFRVEPRIPILEKTDYYPCSDCHDGVEEPIPTIRTLSEEHDQIKLNHGEGRFWCLTCHDIKERDWLVDQAEHKISFDDANKLCAMCHFKQERDFTYGAHGKRLGSWRGERLLLPCTSCHNPHNPKIEPRKAWQPPNARRGLKVTQVPPNPDPHQ